ncbi:MAG: rod shape-determining protein MreC [Lachnospiraceae bacterium]
MRDKLKLLKEQIRPKTVLMALTVLCFISLAFSYFSKDMAVSVREAIGYVIIPMQSGINKVGSKFAEMSQKKLDLEEALAKVESLESELELCYKQLDSYQADSQENQELRELLKLQNTYSDYEMVGANIVSRNSNNWYNQFTIDKGTADGLAVDMNVIADGGLVGIITSISENFAVVTSIIDDSMNVSGEDKESGDTCIVEGSLEEYDSGRVKLSYMKATDDISKKSQIVTSQVSNKYLPGIVIGTVQEVEIDENRLTKTGYLVPAVDFYHLKQVLVITTLKEIQD